MGSTLLISTSSKETLMGMPASYLEMLVCMASAWILSVMYDRMRTSSNCGKGQRRLLHDINSGNCNGSWKHDWACLQAIY